MNRVAPPVLLLHSDRPFIERVRRACLGRYELRMVQSWEGLRRVLREAPPMCLVVVDPYEGSIGRSGLSDTLHEILKEFPSATVLAACTMKQGCLDDIRSLGEWGVTRIIGLEEDDTPLAIARVLESSQGRPLRSLLHRSLPATMGGRPRAILMSAADIVSAGGVGSGLARSLHVTPRTLQRWCRRTGLPAPRNLLVWMRLLLAAEMLDDPGRSVLGVALACGYSSDAALRNAFRAILGVSPSSLRRRGAFETVSRAFLDVVAGARRMPMDGFGDRGVIPIPLPSRQDRAAATALVAPRLAEAAKV